MKKLYLVITLFISSFFLFNSDVKAATFYNYDVTLDSSYFVNNQEIYKKILLLKNKADEFIISNEYNYHYYFITIDYSLDKFSSDNVRVVFLPDIIVSLTGDYTSSYFRYTLKDSSGKYKLCHYYNLDSDGNLFKDSSSTFFYIYNSSSFSYIFYSNFDLLLSGNASINYNFTDTSFTDTVKITSLIDIYSTLGLSIEVPNPHKEEIEKVGNFYTVVIEKLGYLVEEISSNYIYLSIIVIFLLILVFKLVFRRFL